MLRLCHSRAPASEGTSKLELSTGIECILESNRARRQHSARALAGAARVTSRCLRTTLTPKLGARGYDGAEG